MVQHDAASAASSGDDIVLAAAGVHNNAVRLGQEYRALLAALDVRRRDAYREGGRAAVEDFADVAGAARVASDLVGFLVAAGLGPVLVAAAGRQDHKPNLDFASRYVNLASGGGLLTYRGQPNPDPMSAHAHVPGVTVRR